MDEPNQASDSEQTDNRTFAFGDNVINGCDCPSMRAGINPDGDINARRVAKRYDKIVRLIVENDTGVGTIPEDVARDAWADAIQSFKDGSAEYGYRCISVGEDVADELGWDIEV